MSQITERYVRNFVRGFNEAFGDYGALAAPVERRPNSGMVIGGSISISVQITDETLGTRAAWFAEDGALCGPPELLRELDEEKERKAAETRRLAQAGFEKARQAAERQTGCRCKRETPCNPGCPCANSQMKGICNVCHPRPAMDMSLLHGIPEED